jgi:SPP1 gp7 family putative phage head morphogenesis protein
MDKRIIDKIRKGVRKRPPKWMFPYNMEKEYLSYLMGYSHFINELIKEILIPNLENSYRVFNNLDSIHRDSFSDDITNLINTITLRLDKYFKIDPKIMTYKIANKVSNFNEEQWGKIQTALFGINIYAQEKWLEPILKSFVAENVALIKTIKSKAIDDLIPMINREFKAGILFSDIKKEIQNKYQNTIWNAERIARDQVGKLNSQLTQTRQEDVGIESYIWRGMRDERERGNPTGLFPDAIPSHWDREGKVFKWDSPPEGGHAGYAILCRCYAEPNFNSIKISE